MRAGAIHRTLALLVGTMAIGCAMLGVLCGPALAAGVPTVATGGAKSVTATSATLTGTVNPNGESTSYHFEYGTTTAYGSTSPTGDAGSGTKNVNASEAISGLAPNTKYHYRLAASNSSGTTTGADKTFTTPNTAAPSAPAGVPTVATGGAKGVTSTSATLTGTVNPNGQSTTYYFKYGTITNYGGTTPSGSASGTKNVNVSATISGLAASTTYHYRLFASNSSGTSMGADKTFKTPKSTGAAATIGALPNPLVFGQTATISGKVSGPKAAHAAVTLQGAPGPGGPWVTIAGTVANPNGAYAIGGVRTGSNTYFRVLANNGAVSGPLLVGVRFRITFFVSTRHPFRGQLIRFHGRVTPRHNGAFVRIQRLGSDRRWHKIARTRLHRTGGNFSLYSIRIVARRGGLYRAAVGPDRKHLGNTSRALRIRLR